MLSQPPVRLVLAMWLSSLTRPAGRSAAGKASSVWWWDTWECSLKNFFLFVPWTWLQRMWCLVLYQPSWDCKQWVQGKKANTLETESGKEKMPKFQMIILSNTILKRPAYKLLVLWDIKYLYGLSHGWLDIYSTNTKLFRHCCWCSSDSSKSNTQPPWPHRACTKLEWTYTTIIKE